MDKPKRIQRKRVKGWRKPPNTVNVTRPGKWGSPLKLIGDMIYIDASHRRKNLDPWVYLCHGDLEKMLRIYLGLVTGYLMPGGYDIEMGMIGDLAYWSEKIRSLNKEELRGKDIMCFCEEGDPCHGNILLEIANA